MSDAVRFCMDAIESGRGARVATANLDFVAQALGNSQLRSQLERSDLVVADGAPVAALARVVGARSARRVAGVDLVQEICDAGSRNGGLSVALYGAAPEVASAAADRIERGYPGVRVALTLSPPYRELDAEERARDANAIGAAEPNLVLVALGCPRQEQVIEEYYPKAPQAVWIGIGGTLDFLAGRKRRAPSLAQRAGLEWAVRLLQEPRRLWRRYLLRDLPALARVMPGCLWRGIRVRVS